MLKRLVLLSALFIFFAVPTALAAEAPGLNLGENLFESTELGTEGFSCSGCHPQGKGLELVGDFNELELKEIINACLRDAIKTDILATDSPEMNALYDYVRMFQQE